MDTAHALKQQRAAALKERVYLAFTALAVILALRAHGDSITTSRALLTLTVAITGTALAVWLADLLSHITIHTALPDRFELRSMTATAFGALNVTALPIAPLLLAATGLWATTTALLVATLALVTTLTAIGYLAIRALPLAGSRRFFLLLAEVAAALVVIALELLAHI